jgi:hypothetical protein
MPAADWAFFTMVGEITAHLGEFPRFTDPKLTF